MIMLYRILSEQSSAELETAVEAKLSMGWELVGGVSVCAVYAESFGTDHLYSQAMVKKDA